MLALCRFLRASRPLSRTDVTKEVRFFMIRLAIQLDLEGTRGVCALCGTQVLLAGQPQLVLAETRDVVCRDCGHKRAPSLAALLDLLHDGW